MNSYQNAWKQIIQAPKKKYDDLFDFNIPETCKGSEIKKFDFEIDNKSNRKWNCSLVTPVKDPPVVLVVYLHSFSGNKLEGSFLVDQILPEMNLLLFDFYGCGNSEGDYVTLGLKEKDDLRHILKEIKQAFLPTLKRVYLWGRSMGAVAIIHFLYEYQQFMNNMIKPDPKSKHFDTAEYGYTVEGVVLDSPFTDCYKMIKDILKREKNIPGFFSSIILFPIKSSIKSHTKCDVLSGNKPIKKVDIIKVPAIFMIGEKDQLVDQQGFQKMFDLYKAERKKLHYMIDTEHADFRNDCDVVVAVNYLKAIEETKFQEKGKVSKPKLSI